MDNHHKLNIQKNAAYSYSILFWHLTDSLGKLIQVQGYLLNIATYISISPDSHQQFMTNQVMVSRLKKTKSITGGHGNVGKWKMRLGNVIDTMVYNQLSVSDTVCQAAADRYVIFRHHHHQSHIGKHTEIQVK